MIDLDELERLAQAATPGPWEADCDSGFVSGICQFWDKSEYDFDNPHNNAAYIAATNPQTVLELIAHIRSLENEVHGLRDERNTYKRMINAMCGEA